MTIVDQIIASLSDEPDKWTFHPETKRTWELCGPPGGWRLFKTPGYGIQTGGHFGGWNTPNIWHQFRLRRAVRKWQRRVR